MKTKPNRSTVRRSRAVKSPRRHANGTKAKQWNGFAPELCGVSRVASPRYILDTGPLVAFANAADEHHVWARGVLNALGEAPVTCEIVLAEACYVLANAQRAVDLVLALPVQGRVTVESVLANESESVRTA
eukprot:gene44603-60411_t